MSSSKIKEIDDALDRDEVNPNADVIIKSEYHYSTADLKEELALLRTEAFDAVVFEVARESVEEVTTPTLIDRIIGLTFFIFSPLYTDQKPLLAALSPTDTTPFYTRERDRDVIQELPTPFPALTIVLWIVFFGLAIILAALVGTAFQIFGYGVAYWHLSVLSFLAVFGLPIVIRIIRGKIGRGLNRNQIMVNRIEKAHPEAGKTLAIVGAEHSNQIYRRLPDTIEASVIPPSHEPESVSGLKEFLPGLFKTVLLFTALWLIIDLVGNSIIRPLFVIVG